MISPAAFFDAHVFPCLLHLILIQTAGFFECGLQAFQQTHVFDGGCQLVRQCLQHNQIFWIEGIYLAVLDIQRAYNFPSDTQREGSFGACEGEKRAFNIKIIGAHICRHAGLSLSGNISDHALLPDFQAQPRDLLGENPVFGENPGSFYGMYPVFGTPVFGTPCAFPCVNGFN